MGKIREALADRLRREFKLQITAADLWVQNPCFSKWDCARWGGQAITPEGIAVNVHSWDTMTDCVTATELGVVGNEIGLMELTAIHFEAGLLEKTIDETSRTHSARTDRKGRPQNEMVRLDQAQRSDVDRGGAMRAVAR